MLHSPEHIRPSSRAHRDPPFVPPLSGRRRGALAAPEAIEQAVIQVFGVDRSDLRRMTRGRAKVALARQVAMYLAHIACGLSLTETGKLFARDRTTVAHACCVVEDRRDDPVFDRALDLLEWAVRSLATRPWPSHMLSS